MWIHPKSHVFTLSCNTIECRQKKYHIIIDASSSQFFTSLTIFILSSSFVLFEVLSWRIVKCPVCAHWCWFNLISRLRAAAFQVRIIKWKTAQSRSSSVNSINIIIFHISYSYNDFHRSNFMEYSESFWWIINLHNSNSKSLNRVEVRAGLRPILKFDQVHTKWPIEFGKFTVNSQVYRWWTNHRTMRAQSQNLQSAKFWWWWIQLLLFTPTSYDCTRTGRQLWQSVTSNNANNSNDQHLQQHF